LSFTGGPHSLRVKATSLMATRLSARSLSVALNVLQPVDPEICLLLSSSDAELFLMLLTPWPFSSTQELSPVRAVAVAASTLRLASAIIAMR
jgi:hypothetical protein